MKEFNNKINNEILYTRSMLEKIKTIQYNMENVTGTLWMDHHNGNTQYYIRYNGQDEGRRRIYLPKKEMKQVRILAQVDYLKKARKLLERQLAILENFSKKYDENALLIMTSNLSADKRNLIEPLVFTDEEYVAKWLAVEYKGKDFDENVPLFYTEKGERVRSKSEMAVYQHIVDIYKWPMSF